MDRLKLIAFDKDDLEIVSAHVQDAVTRVADIRYVPRERRLILAMNRFDWVSANGANGAKGDGGGHFERRRAVLHFEAVNGVKCRDVPHDSKDTVLNLLAITFEEREAPGGCVDIHFSGGGVLRLDVECIEARLADLDAAWQTRNCPDHETLPQPQTIEIQTAVGARQ